MQDVAVEVVGEDLCMLSDSSPIDLCRDVRTSRKINPLKRSLKIPHGIGSVVVTFNALRI